MGGIDLDPFSESVFQTVVEADSYYSLTERGEDGILLPWAEKTHVNHPGGLTKESWRKLLDEIKIGRVEKAVWVGFNMNQLCLLAEEEFHPLDFSTVLFRKRRKFVRHDGYSGSPSQDGYTTVIGCTKAEFEREFSGLGKIIHGEQAL